ncbi:MAG: hypothetical protein R3C42_01240 [Parvularculaceae bacterium]
MTQPHARVATGATFAATSGFENNAIGIGEDLRIEGVSLDGDRIALHVESPNGAEIIVYDYVEGRVIALAPIVTAGIAEGDGLPPRRSAADRAPVADYAGGRANSRPGLRRRRMMRRPRRA